MTSDDETATLPERRVFWAWVASSARRYIGWLLIVLGAISIFFGWYGVSGQSITAKQLPYLASGSVTGLALIIVAVMLLVTDDGRRSARRLAEVERKVGDLYTLLVVEEPPDKPLVADIDASAAATRPGLDAVAVPAGTTYHRPDCALVAAKADVETVDAAAIAARSLQPCKVCEPPVPSPGS